MPQMTSRDRVISAVKRLSTDRVPVASMGFADTVAAGVRRLLGAPEDSEIGPLLSLDMCGIAPAYLGPDFGYKPEEGRRSFFGSSHKTYAESVVERPLRHANTVRDVEAFRWPTIEDYSFEHIARSSSNGSDLALCGPGWTPTFSQLCEVFGIETTLVNIAANPALIEAAVERITDLVCGVARGLHSATGGTIPIFKTSDDYATQRGMMFSPDHWRKLFRPGLAKQFEVAKDLGMLVMIHACGDIHEILPEMVDAGLDILEPTQAHLSGMDPGKLKRELGDRLTFFGAISTQKALPYGSPQDVKSEVEKRIRVLGDGGGYIVSPDHTVLDDVPPENVIALYQAAGSLET